MLIIQRKMGEQVLIADGAVQLKILNFDKHRKTVRFGFTAPSHIVIDREEIHLKKLNHNGRKQ